MFVYRRHADLDAPNPANPTDKEYLQWLAVNIPGKDVASGDEIAQYLGPVPPKDTGNKQYRCITHPYSVFTLNEVYL